MINFIKGFTITLLSVYMFFIISAIFTGMVDQRHEQCTTDYINGIIYTGLDYPYRFGCHLGEIHE